MVHPLFQNADVGKIDGNFIEMIGQEWFLFTAGTIKHYNTMTAAWGGMGFLWRKPVVFCFIRPTRYTYEFAEAHENFSVSFFPEKHKDILNLCGTKSGRDINKAEAAGLIPFEGTLGTVLFEQASLALECRKIYFDDIKPELFIDKSIDKLYNNDYHRMYVGEICNCFIRKQ